jgi:hypothetical protein
MRYTFSTGMGTPHTHFLETQESKPSDPPPYYIPKALPSYMEM